MITTRDAGLLTSLGGVHHTAQRRLTHPAATLG